LQPDCGCSECRRFNWVEERLKEERERAEREEKMRERAEREKKMRERQEAAAEKRRRAQEEEERKANSPPGIALRRIRKDLDAYQARVRQMCSLSRNVRMIRHQVSTALNTLKGLSRGDPEELATEISSLACQVACIGTAMADEDVRARQEEREREEEREGERKRAELERQEAERLEEEREKEKEREKEEWLKTLEAQAREEQETKKRKAEEKERKQKEERERRLQLDKEKREEKKLKQEQAKLAKLEAKKQQKREVQEQERREREAKMLQEAREAEEAAKEEARADVDTALPGPLLCRRDIPAVARSAGPERLRRVPSQMCCPLLGSLVDCDTRGEGQEKERSCAAMMEREAEEEAAQESAEEEEEEEEGLFKANAVNEEEGKAQRERAENAQAKAKREAERVQRMTVGSALFAPRRFRAAGEEERVTQRELGDEPECPSLMSMKSSPQLPETPAGVCGAQSCSHASAKEETSVQDYYMAQQRQMQTARRQEAAASIFQPYLLNRAPIAFTEVNAEEERMTEHKLGDEPECPFLMSMMYSLQLPETPAEVFDMQAHTHTLSLFLSLSLSFSLSLSLSRSLSHSHTLTHTHCRRRMRSRSQRKWRWKRKGTRR